MTAQKTPQDHQKKAEPEKLPAGHDIVKPFEEVPAWDQAKLLAAVVPLQGIKDGELSTEAVLAMGNIAELMQVFVTDQAAYLKIASGKDGLMRAVELAGWFAEQLGE